MNKIDDLRNLGRNEHGRDRIERERVVKEKQQCLSGISEGIFVLSLLCVNLCVNFVRTSSTTLIIFVFAVRFLICLRTFVSQWLKARILMRFWFASRYSSQLSICAFRLSLESRVVLRSISLLNFSGDSLIHFSHISHSQVFMNI